MSYKLKNDGVFLFEEKEFCRGEEKLKDVVREIHAGVINEMFDRLLTHHSEFKIAIIEFNKKLDSVVQLINDEKIQRIDAQNRIANELHSRINSILLSILGGAGGLILAIILWLVQTNKGN